MAFSRRSAQSIDGWLDTNAGTHRHAADCGRKAVETFRKSNIIKRGMPKRKRKYAPPDSTDGNLRLGYFCI